MTREDAARLARLQRDALPDSALSRLGERYLRGFWRFCAASERERVFVSRGPDGRTVAAAMVSLSPNDLGMRLLRGTTLILYAWKILPMLVAGGDGQAIPGAELVLLFTEAQCRGKGTGAALLAEAEAALAAEGLSLLHVRTFDDPTHPAYRFYVRAGYAPIRSFTAHGKPFALLSKAISCPPSGARPETVSAPLRR